MTPSPKNTAQRTPAQLRREAARLSLFAAAALFAAAGVSAAIHFTLYKVTIIEGLTVAGIFYFVIGVGSLYSPSSEKSTASEATEAEQRPIPGGQPTKKLNLARALKAADYVHPVADLNEEDPESESHENQPMREVMMASAE